MKNCTGLNSVTVQWRTGGDKPSSFIQTNRYILKKTAAICWPAQTVLEIRQHSICVMSSVVPSYGSTVLCSFRNPPILHTHTHTHTHKRLAQIKSYSTRSLSDHCCRHSIATMPPDVSRDVITDSISTLMANQLSSMEVWSFQVRVIHQHTQI